MFDVEMPGEPEKAKTPEGLLKEGVEFYANFQRFGTLVDGSINLTLNIAEASVVKAVTLLAIKDKNWIVNIKPE